MKILDRLLTKHKERVIGLDILRSIAILLVVYRHGANLIPEPHKEAYEILDIIRLDGVSIFFVLSGFLIGGILLKTIKRTSFTKKDLLNFWVRRWFRTVPNYALVFIWLFVYDALILKASAPDLRYVFFLQNFASPSPDFFPESWSLSVEEWFYLLFPICCFVLHKSLNNRSKAVLISALIFLLFPMAIRIIKFECAIGLNDFDKEFRKIVLLRLDSLMYGVIAAYLFFRWPFFWRKYKYAFFCVGAALLLLLYIDPLHWSNAYPPLSFNIESVTTFCFLPFLSTYKTTKLKLVNASFIFISLISYSMYLLNLTPIQRRIMPLINNFLKKEGLSISDGKQYLLFWILTVAGSYILYRFYEKPMTGLRDRFPTRSASASPNAPTGI